MRFDFATATRIVFGPGRIREGITAAASSGRKALIVTGNTPERLNSFFQDLRTHGVEYATFPISGEPTIPAVLLGIEAARNEGCDVIIGVGGGSAMDAAKAIAALLSNPGDPLNYLEVVGKGNPLTQACAPCICIPTTAGTGTEVTRNAVLVSPEHRVKVSLRSPRMFPMLAVVDPDLTTTLPPSITTSTGMDALTQLIEPFVSNAANPVTDAVCREGIRRAALWLRTACVDGNNREARENMSLASLFGGLALANAGLGAVHGLAAPLGGTCAIPHGVVCARLLSGVIRANLKALRSRAADSPALARYDEIAQCLTGSASATADEGVQWIEWMCSDLSIPQLSSFGLAAGDLLSISEKALRSSSMKGNPIQLTVEELNGILIDAFSERLPM